MSRSVLCKFVAAMARTPSLLLFERVEVDLTNEELHELAAGCAKLEHSTAADFRLTFCTLFGDNLNAELKDFFLELKPNPSLNLQNKALSISELLAKVVLQSLGLSLASPFGFCIAQPFAYASHHTGHRFSVRISTATTRTLIWHFQDPVYDEAVRDLKMKLR